MFDAPTDGRFPVRKRPVHTLPQDYLDRSTIIFLTVCTKERRRILDNETAHRELRSAWEAADRWLVGRYMIMPDHVHFFCAPGSVPAMALRDWTRYWKSRTTRILGLGEGNLWQTDFWDVQLRRRERYELKWDYVRQNPVRAGLTANSAAWPFQGELHEMRWRG